MSRQLTGRRGALVAAVVLGALLPALAHAQAGILRGVVTDTAGRPLPNVEVLSVNAKRTTRTDAGGRFTLAKLPFGQQLILARLPGYQPADQAVTMLDEAPPDLTFRLRRVVVALDTVRIVSHDGCAAYNFAGFDCRRRAGIGQFRGESEIAALRPIYWADMFDELPGFRRYPVPDSLLGRDWKVESTTGWRCLMEGWNGRHKTAADQAARPRDIVGVEHYDTYDKVPAAYKRLAWPTGQDKPCALIMYWTRGFIENGNK